MINDKPATTYIPQLDGIRGLAIILVITFHYWGNYSVFSFGWSGVDLFFVLSGYLITSRLIDTQKHEHALRNFYFNRALRILPVYYATLILFYIAFNFFVKSSDFFAFKFYNQHWPGFTFFFQNWILTYSEGTRGNFLEHFWSLAIEEQFYILWPFFLFAFWQKKYFYKLILILLLAIILMRTFVFFQYPERADYRHYFYNTFFRMDGFIIGGCLFLFQRAKRTSYITSISLVSLILLAGGILFFKSADLANPVIGTIGYTLIALMFAGLIYKSCNQSSEFLSTVFNYKWIKFTGKISYGLYIYHWLVLQILVTKIKTLLIKSDYLSNSFAQFLSLVICLAISFIISTLSYYFFELYFLKHKIRVKQKPVGNSSLLP